MVTFWLCGSVLSGVGGIKSCAKKAWTVPDFGGCLGVNFEGKRKRKVRENGAGKEGGQEIEEELSGSGILFFWAR